MSFVVSEECVQLGLRAGAIIFRNVQVMDAPPALRSEIAAAVETLRARFTDPAAIRAIPEVSAFRDLLRRAGANPRKEQPSVERLLSFALKRADLPAINSLVDSYNLISIRSLCSLGAHDLDRIRLPVALRLLTGQESFTPLGQDTQTSVIAGEYGYVDAANRVLCRLDVLQAEFSKVTTSTENVLLIVEGTTAHSPESVRQTFRDVMEMVRRYCGGTAEVVALP
jgi:DNA/RNA-binding domain of Phe-tRNA-synthetase-like protein